MSACHTCGLSEPDVDFYPYQRSECRACTCRRVREHRHATEQVREYDRKRAKQPHRKAKARKVTIRWRTDHPDRYRAQTAVGNALRDGKIEKKPCFFCNTTKNLHAHHRDYSKPLEVTWLCAKCHHRLHTLLPDGAGHAEAAE